MNDHLHKKAVFFLGAGFSRAIISDYPTLKDLSEKITSNFNGEKGSVTYHFYDEILKQYKENIEHLLTFLSSNLPFKTDVQISADEALYKDLKNKIVKFFEEKENRSNIIDNKIKLGIDNREELCKYLCKNKVSCITLNYDLLLEHIISNTNNILHDRFEAFYQIPMTSIIYRSGINYVAIGRTPEYLPKILKLHGSINWFYAGISQSDPVFCNNDRAKKNFAYLCKDLQPMIVPPVMDKTSIYNHTILKAIWRQAFDELREADEIYICGFSFPETDLSIRFLFQSALEKNENLQRIYFINTDRDRENKIEHFSKALAGYEKKLNFDYCCKNSLDIFIENIIKPQIK